MQALRFKRQQESNVDVNLTPLIDVVFLLLIFFMVSTSFTREAHLSLTLPEAESSQVSSTETAIDVVVDKDGFYRINGRLLVDAKKGTLSSALSLEADGDFSVPLTVTADQKAPYQRVVSVIDIGGQMGFTQINLTTQPDNAQTVGSGIQ